jgi:putative flippase GtrA
VNARAATFAVVGGLGFVVQLAALAALIRAGCPLAVATALAVEAAVVHNFCWHERWTWKDRRNGTSRLVRLVRFHGANGIVSIATNVILTSIVVRTLGWPPLMPTQWLW